MYVALTSNGNSKITLEEIANNLSVPRHFLGKIMKKLVKENILSSAKGPSGGFSITERTLSTKLIQMVLLVDGKNRFDRCVLHFRECNALHPCPLHKQMEKFRTGVREIITETTIGDMIANDRSELFRSIANSPAKIILNHDENHVL